MKTKKIELAVQIGASMMCVSEGTFLAWVQRARMNKLPSNSDEVRALRRLRKYMRKYTVDQLKTMIKVDTQILNEMHK